MKQDNIVSKYLLSFNNKKYILMLITTKKPTLAKQQFTPSARAMSNDHGCEIKRLGRSRQSTNHGTVISDHSLHLSMPPSPVHTRMKYLS
jgi:hypothetical protein